MDDGLLFTEAAHVGGITANSLRGWLNRKEVYFDGDASRPRRNSGPLRKFSVADALRIGLISELMRHGVQVERASAIIESAFDFAKMAKSGVTIAEMAKRFERFTLVLWLDRSKEGGWLWAMEPRRTAPANVPCTVRLSLSIVARDVAARLEAHARDL